MDRQPQSELVRDASPLSLGKPFFHNSPTHDEALARLQFLVENNKRLGLLVGKSGAGKSTVLKVLAGLLFRKGAVAAGVNLIGVDAGEYLWNLSDQLACKPAPQDALFVLWRRITDRIAENDYQGVRTVILLDDVDQADPEVLTYVRRMAAGNPARPTRATFILSAASSSPACIPPELIQQVDLRIDIEPWTEAETVAFLHAAIEHSSGAGSGFEQTAAARIHQLSLGSPREVRRLAELSMAAAAGRGLTQIDQPTIDSVHDELVAKAV